MHAEKGKPIPSFEILETAMNQCLIGQTDRCFFEEVRPYFLKIDEKVINASNTIDNILDSRTQKVPIRDVQLVKEKKAGGVLLEKIYMLDFSDDRLAALSITFVKRGDNWRIQRFNYTDKTMHFWQMVGFD